MSRLNSKFIERIPVVHGHFIISKGSECNHCYLLIPYLLLLFNYFLVATRYIEQLEEINFLESSFHYISICKISENFIERLLKS